MIEAVLIVLLGSDSFQARQAATEYLKVVNRIVDLDAELDYCRHCWDPEVRKRAGEIWDDLDRFEGPLDREAIWLSMSVMAGGRLFNPRQAVRLHYRLWLRRSLKMSSR